MDFLSSCFFFFAAITSRSWVTLMLHFGCLSYLHNRHIRLIAYPKLVWLISREYLLCVLFSFFLFCSILCLALENFLRKMFLFTKCFCFFFHLSYQTAPFYLVYLVSYACVFVLFIYEFPEFASHKIHRISAVLSSLSVYYMYLNPLDFLTTIIIREKVWL